MYNRARTYFIHNPQHLINLEQYIFETITHLISQLQYEIKRDYDEASFLYPFWRNYPPEKRGRQPIGDQVPWIEVGENVIGAKLSRILPTYFAVRDSGIPSGPDNRYVVSHKRIREITGITDSAWLFVDIKSVGPRDDADHAVMSHNQISGDGLWTIQERMLVNTPILAIGPRASHNFFCAIPPLYVLSTHEVVPVIHVVIKPVYGMLSMNGDDEGQPLQRIDLAAIPNGLLLMHGPRYLERHPGLFFPGKDDKKKPPTKIRARVSFSILREIAPWRFVTFQLK